MKDLSEEFSFAHKIPKTVEFLRPFYYVALFILIFLVGVFDANEFIYFKF